eukprot:gene24517-24600_t
MLAGVLVKYDDYHNATTFAEEERPETFGDLTAESEQVDDVDAKKPLQEGERTNTKFTVNKQGLRMFHSVAFPKTRQRVLFLGDSRILNPFINDDHTITQQLQMRYPDKEILNAGHASYTMEDYLSLYREKSRYAEPDIVIVCTNGGDILDEYFSQRNRYARSEKVYRPTEQEHETLKYPVGRYEPPATYAKEDLEEWIAILSALPSWMDGCIQNLDYDQLRVPYRPGGWTIQQVIHHLADSHMNAYIRLKLALTEDNPTIKPYDQDAWALLPNVEE